MKNLTLISFLFALVIWLPSCVAPMYIPSSVPVAFHDTSGQLDLRIGVRNGQASLSVTKHLAIKAMFQGGQYRSEPHFLLGSRDSDPYANSTNKMRHAAIGLEYFDAKNILRGKIVLMKQIAAGAGLGSQEYDYSSRFDAYYNQPNYFKYDLKTRFTSVFLQPGISCKFFGRIAINVSARFTGMFYSVLDFETTNYDAYMRTYKAHKEWKSFGPLEEFRLPVDFRNQSKVFALFVEPAVTFRVLPQRWYFFQAQIGFSKCLNRSDMDARQLFFEFSTGFRVYQLGKVFGIVPRH